MYIHTLPQCPRAPPQLLRNPETPQILTQFLSSRLKDYDYTLRSAMSTIINSHLDSTAWTQPSFPSKAGGLGIHSAEHLVPSAFLSSTLASNGLVHHILPPRFATEALPHMEAAHTVWKCGHDNPSSLPPSTSLILSEGLGLL